MCHRNKVLTFILHLDDHTYFTVSFQFNKFWLNLNFFAFWTETRKYKSGKKRQWCLSFRAQTHLLLIEFAITKQRALKIIVPHLNGADTPFNKGFGRVEQKKNTFVKRRQKIFAGDRRVDVKILMQQTCSWLWTRSLWLCLRGTGTRWLLLVERLIALYKLSWKKKNKKRGETFR